MFPWKVTLDRFDCEHLYMYDIHINLYMLNYEKKEKKEKNINKINNHFSPQTIVRGLGVIVV